MPNGDCDQKGNKNHENNDTDNATQKRLTDTNFSKLFSVIGVAAQAEQTQ